MTPGRVIPHDTEAEAALLAAVLFSKDALDVAIERVTADDFYKPGHGHVFAAAAELYGMGQPADPVSVAAHLESHGLLEAAGGRASIMDYYTSPGTATAAGRYADIVADHALARRLISVGNTITDLGYEPTDDVPKAVDEAEQAVYELSAGRCGRRGALALGEGLAGWLDALEARYERGDELVGTPTGFYDLDECLLGLQAGQLIGIAGRPSMGKTAFGLAMALNMAGAGYPVLFVSLEMSRPELENRIVAMQARIDSQRIRSGKLVEKDWPRISQALGQLVEMPLHLDDDAGASLLSLRSQARRIKAQRGQLGAVIVDYLQLMTPPKKAENRQVEVADLSRGLKRMSLELDVPVVALSQLNRDLERRGDKRPTLADLRESGAIENDCDVVAFIYRDEVYNTESPDRGTAEIIVAKHRNGPTGVARLAFQEQYMTFANMARAGDERGVA